MERLATATSSSDDFEPVIKVISSTTGAVQATLLAGEFANFRALDWQKSAGGTLIVVSARHEYGRRPKDGQYAIYTASTTGGAPTLIVPGDARYPSWSPDDTEIAYESDNGKPEAINLSTGVVRTISPSNVSHVDWKR